MVNLPDQFWNTLWTDLTRIDEDLARLGISEDTKMNEPKRYVR